MMRWGGGGDFEMIDYVTDIQAIVSGTHEQAKDGQTAGMSKGGEGDFRSGFFSSSFQYNRKTRFVNIFLIF